MMLLTDQQRRLIDGWQRGLPLESQPFAKVAASIGVGELDVLAQLKHLVAVGVLSRVGATIRPNTVGASLLGAMRVHPKRIDEVAAIVSSNLCVNHNYEREHEFNLWFVVTAPDATALAIALHRLRTDSGHDILELPMERAYYLDLGFPLDMTGREDGTGAYEMSSRELEEAERRLLLALEDGLELVPHPYTVLGSRCGLTEDDTIGCLRRLVNDRIITRLGLIARHRTLGISANAMAVWDIEDSVVDTVGVDFASFPFVTLCYRRPRRLPAWPYNLFTMVHGRDRATVERQIAELATHARVAPDRRAVLFSRRCFVQRGARYRAA